MVLLGNLISFVGCILMIVGGFIKNKKYILSTQCVQFGIQALGHLVLGAVTGVVSCVVSVVRILVFTRVKVTVWLKLGFVALQVLLTLWTGADSFIEWLPLLSMIAYTWYLDTENVITFKIANMIGLVMWVVFDLHYRNYVSFSFDILTLISTTVGIGMILFSKKKPQDPESDPNSETGE